MKKLLLVTMLSALALVSCTKEEAPVETTPETTETAPATTESTETAEEPKSETTENTTPTDVKMIMPYGTPALSAVQFITEQPAFEGNVNVTYEPIEATDVLTTALVNGEADIAIVPTNLVATLNSKGLDYKLVGTSVWGTFYIASSEGIDTLDELKGKTVTTFGQNLTPDAILKYILVGNGINPDTDLTLNYLGGAPEVATSFIAGESNTVLATQPVLTGMLLKRQDAVAAIDLQDEWENLTGFESYPQASLIISNELIESNPTFVENFISQYDDSIDWVNENPKAAGDYYEALNLGLTSAVLEKAIPECSLDFVDSADAHDSIASYLDILFHFNPKLVGESQPDESIYYKK